MLHRRPCYAEAVIRRDPIRLLLVALCCAALVAVALTPVGAALLLAVLPVALALFAATERRSFSPVLVPLPVSPRLARTSTPRAPPLS